MPLGGRTPGGEDRGPSFRFYNYRVVNTQHCDPRPSRHQPVAGTHQSWQQYMYTKYVGRHHTSPAVLGLRLLLGLVAGAAAHRELDRVGRAVRRERVDLVLALVHAARLVRRVVRAGGPVVELGLDLDLRRYNHMCVRAGGSMSAVSSYGAGERGG